MQEINTKCFIPNYQFKSNKNHNTIEQVRSSKQYNLLFIMANNIIQSKKKDNYCTAVFLAAEKAFDKVFRMKD